VTIRWQNNVSLPLRIIWLNNKCRKMYVSAAVADDAKRTNIVLTCEERDDSE
jgi:head-tail adaptor